MRNHSLSRHLNYQFRTLPFDLLPTVVLPLDCARAHTFALVILISKHSHALLLMLSGLLLQNAVAPDAGPTREIFLHPFC